jgi:hypothetical protein
MWGSGTALTRACRGGRFNQALICPVENLSSGVVDADSEESMGLFDVLLRKKEHIPPHRIWSFLTGTVDLGMSEHIHMVTCNQCVSVLKTCLDSQSFGEVLLKWTDEAPHLDRAS